MRAGGRGNNDAGAVVPVSRHSRHRHNRHRHRGRRTNRADRGGDSNGLGRDDGAVSRAVGDLGSARGDGVNLGRVDGRRGQGNHGGLDLGRAGRAVGDALRAGGDGDQLGGVVGGHIASDGGTSHNGSGSSSETHLGGLIREERK